MNSPRAIALAVVLLLGAVPVAVLADQSLMTLTFDDKTIDEPLGQGGTSMGEATWYHGNTQAIVRATPFETPSLELHCTDGPCPIEFDLLSGGVTSGLAVIIMDLWLDQTGPGWDPLFEFYSTNWEVQLSILFAYDGTIQVRDSELAASVPSYATGRSLPVMIAMNLDSDTYSVWIDQNQCVADRPLALTNKDFGITLIQVGHNGQLETHFSIDQIRVLDWLPPLPTERTSWGVIRAGFRD